MWFKKKSVLQGEGNYNSNTAADGSDWRTTIKNQGWSVSRTLPSAADANNYFYLPALGYYNSGPLSNVGDHGYYWSSSAGPWGSKLARSLYFTSGTINVNYGNRYDGFRAEALFE